MSYNKALITGGAVFMGSHLVNNFVNKGWNIVVLDNLSHGNLKNIRKWLQNEQFKFVKGDLKKTTDAQKAVKDVELVFYTAANPEVHVRKTEPSVHVKRKEY